MSDIECLVTAFVAGPELYYVSAAAIAVKEDATELEGPDWRASFQSPKLLRTFLEKRMDLSPNRVAQIMKYIARGDSFTFVERLSPRALDAVRRRHKGRKRRRAFEAHG